MSTAEVEIEFENPRIAASYPIEVELAALREFCSPDTTRPHLITVWKYKSEGGLTFLATDGHTLALRRAGSHREMPLHEIAKLTPTAHTADVPPACRPPPWDVVFGNRDSRKPSDYYDVGIPKPVEVWGVNTDYIARVAKVERAALKRAKHDFESTTRLKGKARARATRCLAGTACATLRLAGQLDPWYFRLDMPAALWEILIMPRRP